MKISLSVVKVLKTDFEKVILEEEWCYLLMQGKFYEFEKLMHEKIYGLYDRICESLISYTSQRSEFVELQKEVAQEEGLKKLEIREGNIRLRTGTKIHYDSLYAKQAPKDYIGSRHLSARIWQTGENCSPMYQSISCLFS